MSEIKVNKITPTADCGTVTLGDSGDNFTIPAGVTVTSAGGITNSGTITNTGTISGGTITGNVDGLISWDTTKKTAAFTAVAGNGYFVDTTSAAITVTLPASPSAGDLVAIKDYALTADTNNITIARNGSNIQGIENNFIIETEGQSITLIYIDSTQGWLTSGASNATDITEQALYVTATGGTVTTTGDYKIHTFTGPGTFCVTCVGNTVGSNKVDYLVVAGGGGAGNNWNLGGSGGGGGAGGYRESDGGASGCYSTSPIAKPCGAFTVTVQGYPITVGAGGSGNPYNGNLARAGNSGSNSIFACITSAGGQAGHGVDGTGGSGGSGAGAGSYGGPARPGGAGNTPPVSPPQGNPGGPSSSGSAGGGGATGSGGANGPQGAGASSSITASSVTRAEGGSGGGPSPGGSNQKGGETANSGNGGNRNAGAGGSGIVVIRYKYQN